MLAPKGGRAWWRGVVVGGREKRRAQTINKQQRDSHIAYYPHGLLGTYNAMNGATALDHCIHISDVSVLDDSNLQGQSAHGTLWLLPVAVKVFDQHKPNELDLCLLFCLLVNQFAPRIFAGHEDKKD